MIRNAGGVVSDDAIRSLAISQNLLGTEEIVLIHHTDCGMLTFTDDELASKLEEETGSRPEWKAHCFGDLDDDLRNCIARIREDPFIPRTENVRGFVYEVETGRLREVVLRLCPARGSAAPGARTASASSKRPSGSSSAGPNASRSWASR